MEIQELGDRLNVTGDKQDLDQFADIIAKARELPVYGGSLYPQAIRKSGLDLADGPLAIGCPDTVTREWTDANGVPCCWFRPPASSAVPVLYFHGGGYVAGSVEASRGIAASIALALAAPVLAVDYRQAPENPYPAAVDDANAAYDWIIAQTKEGVIVVGDSAGGALAVIVALEAARRGKRRARAVISSSGWFDLRMRGESWQSSKGHDLVSLELGRMFVDAYLGGADADLVNRLLEDHLDQAPPMLFQMGAVEGPLSDAFTYATKARLTGATIQLEVYAGMPHNWIKFASPVSELAFERMGDWARTLG